MRNRKATSLFTFLVMLGLFFSLSFALVTLALKNHSFTGNLRGPLTGLHRAYLQGEKYLNSADSLAYYMMQQTEYELAKRGGFYSVPECGGLGETPFWISVYYDEDKGVYIRKECLPSQNIDGNLGMAFKEIFDDNAGLLPKRKPFTKENYDIEASYDAEFAGIKAYALFGLTLPIWVTEGANDGYYAIKPSFSASFTGARKRYQELEEFFKRLVNRCSVQSSEISKCFDEGIKEIDSTFYLIDGCYSSGEEESLNKFIDYMYGCKESKGNNCYCDYSMENNAFSLSKQIDSGKVTVALGGASETMEFPLEVEDAEFVTGKDYFIKITDGSITLTRKPREELAKKFSKCTSPDHQAFRVCLKDLSEGLVIYDGGKLSYTNPVYQLALSIADAPPPKIKGLTAWDMPKSNNALIISWDLPDAQDIVKYRVYLSRTGFEGKAIKEVVGKEDVVMQEIGAGHTAANMQQVSSCRINTENLRCFFDASRADGYLEYGKTYVLGNKAVVALNNELIQDGGVSVGVTAVDRAGNYIKSEEFTDGENYVQVKAANDAPYRPLNILKKEYNAQTRTLNLEWRQLDENYPDIYGKSAEEPANLRLYYAKSASRAEFLAKKLSDDDMKYKVIPSNGVKAAVQLPGSKGESYYLFVLPVKSEPREDLEVSEVVLPAKGFLEYQSI